MSSCSASPFEEGGLRTKNLFLCLTLLIQEKKQLTLNKDFLLAQFFFVLLSQVFLVVSLSPKRFHSTATRAEEKTLKNTEDSTNWAT